MNEPQIKVKIETNFCYVKFDLKGNVVVHYPPKDRYINMEQYMKDLNEKDKRMKSLLENNFGPGRWKP